MLFGDGPKGKEQGEGNRFPFSGQWKEAMDMSNIPSREEAWEWLCAYNESESLRHHALAVEGVMRHFARLWGEDEDFWGIVGLLHDLDYEKYPKEHCIKVQEILAEKEVDPAVIRAIACHGHKTCCDLEPVTLCERTLYTIDEVTGLINAAALMRPNRSVMDMELKSLKKKFKDKKFAAGVDRTVVQDGCALLGMELDKVLEECILGMREVAPALGLDGSC